MSAVVPIDAYTPQDAGVLGGKGAGLAFLHRAGLRVPPAFVITVEAFRDAVATPLGDELDRAVAAVGADAPTAELERAAAAIRARVADVAADHPWRAEVAAAYERLSEGAGGAPCPVAVRSSSAAEDAGEHSLAGGHDSFLWVCGADELHARVADCWASLYTARAIAYRARAGVGAEGGMAVCVQEMADARSAGVFMTLDPATGDRSAIVVESVWGLGEPLVSGTANPDRFVVDKITGDVVRRDVARQDSELVRDPGGSGTAEREIPAERRERASLEDAELSELVRMARLVEQRAGAPQDAEFVVTAGEPPENTYVVQCRPETVWSRRAPRVVAGRRSALQSVVSTLRGEDP